MRKLLSALLPAFCALALNAQNVSDLIISEALAQPDSTGILDDYGRRMGWVELYNKSTGTVNFAGCYLTDDLSQLRKSQIPKGDLRTRVGSRQVAILYCSGNGADGSFYTGFTLEPGKTIYLVSNDGRTVIDSLQIPASLPQGHSIAKLARAEDIRLQLWDSLAVCPVPSPRILNNHRNAASGGELMKERDPHGWILSITSVSVVFCALALLWLLFWALFDRPARKKAQPKPVKAAKGTPDGAVAAAIALALDMEQDGDVYAAIATAVHLYLSDAVHDVEPGIVTIRRSQSAWDNKALHFRKLPR